MGQYQAFQSSSLKHQFAIEMLSAEKANGLVAASL